MFRFGNVRRIPFSHSCIPFPPLLQYSYLGTLNAQLNSDFRHNDQYLWMAELD